MHRKYFELLVSWERKLNFFSPLGFDLQRHSDQEIPKIKRHSVRVLKRYLNKKNLTHGRETATILKFSALIYETYFSTVIFMPSFELKVLLSDRKAYFGV